MIKAKCIFMQLQSSGEKLGEAPQNHFQTAGAVILTEQGGPLLLLLLLLFGFRVNTSVRQRT